MRAPITVCGVPAMNTVAPRLKRCFGKSVMTRHFNSPRMACGATMRATTRNSGLDDVEVDAGALARCSGFDQGSEPADDASLAADDLADVFFVDFELVDGRVAVLDLVNFDGVGFVDEGFGDVLDQAFQIRLELFVIVPVVVLCEVVFRRAWRGRVW